MAVFNQFWEAKDNFIYDLAFWRATLLNMQQDPGNEQSECIVTFDEFTVMMNDIISETADSASYYAGLAAKGQGSGTEVGFLLEKGQRYIDSAIFGVNVFNYCDLDYYLVSLGKSLGSASGGVNQLVNLGYRFFSYEDQENYYNMSVAITYNTMDCDGDAACETKKGTSVVDTGSALGVFLSALLSVQVPDTTSTSSYQSVGQLM